MGRARHRAQPPLFPLATLRRRERQLLPLRRTKRYNPIRISTARTNATTDIVEGPYTSLPNTRKSVLESTSTIVRVVSDWSFLTNHARALVWVAHDPGAR